VTPAEGRAQERERDRDPEDRVPAQRRQQNTAQRRAKAEADRLPRRHDSERLSPPRRTVAATRMTTLFAPSIEPPGRVCPVAGAVCGTVRSQGEAADVSAVRGGPTALVRKPLTTSTLITPEARGRNCPGSENRVACLDAKIHP
jgi:hypothetical protein